MRPGRKQGRTPDACMDCKVMFLPKGGEKRCPACRSANDIARAAAKRERDRLRNWANKKQPFNGGREVGEQESLLLLQAWGLVPWPLAQRGGNSVTHTSEEPTT